MRKALMLAIGAGLFFGFTDPANNKGISMMKDVFQATREIKSLTYEFHRTERIGGKMITNQAEVKMQRKPYKVYIREVFPNEGMEVLYPDPEETNKALINPNGFPWINLKLDPTGDLMRRNQHHTVMDGGYDYVVSVMEYFFYKYRGNLHEMVTYQSSVEWNGKTCDVVRMSNEKFQYVNYTVKNGESISSIATKFRLNEYMILQNNPGYGFLSDVQEGDVINLPSDYCSEMVLYIDQETSIPVVMQVFDDKGLFEAYEFRNLQINPEISEEEFSDTFTAYNFY